jgi:hypothetical protein
MISASTNRQFDQLLGSQKRVAGLNLGVDQAAKQVLSISG